MGPDLTLKLHARNSSKYYLFSEGKNVVHKPSGPENTQLPALDQKS